jgi:hypothetical protein
MAERGLIPADLDPAAASHDRAPGDPRPRRPCRSYRLSAYRLSAIGRWTTPRLPDSPTDS